MFKRIKERLIIDTQSVGGRTCIRRTESCKYSKRSWT